MKGKKLVALTVSGAMAVTAVSLMAACGPKEPEGPAFVEDTTVYHVAGSSKNEELPLAWSPNLEGKPDSVIFKKDTTVTNENVYKLEMKLYAGDMFKIVHDEAWENEINAYYFTNAEENADYGTATKNENGDIVFHSESTSSSNITLAEGHDGIYEFILKTYPAKEGEEKYDLSFRLVESIPRLKIPYKMYVYGDMNNWGKSGNVESYIMKKNDTKWTGVLDIKDEDLLRNANGVRYTSKEAAEKLEQGETLYAGVYVYNGGDLEEGDTASYVPTTPADATDILEVENVKSGIGENGDDLAKIILVPKGVYTVLFNQPVDATETAPAVPASCEIKKGALNMYFRGTVNNWATSFADDTHKLEEKAGWWQGYLTVTEDDYADGKEYAEVKLYNAYTGDHYTAAENDGNMQLTAGTYAFKFTVENKKVEYEKVNAWLAGTFMDGTTKVDHAIKVGVTPSFTETAQAGVLQTTLVATNVLEQYSWISTKPNYVDGTHVFCFQIVHGTALLGIKEYGVAGSNDTLSAAGTFTVTLNTNNWTFEITPVNA